jgi:uncharacterized membrane-anchored protein YhcB (DUF1043 family)
MSSLVPVLAILFLLAVVAALVVGLVALSRTTPAARRAARRDPDTVPTDLEGLRREVQALRRESAEALRHLAVVRYDAFGDMGGRLSWSLALADEQGDGVVVTSIHGRSEARTYAKVLTSWSCDQATSPEEDEAVSTARVRRVART